MATAFALYALISSIALPVFVFLYISLHGKYKKLLEKHADLLKWQDDIRSGSVK